MFLGVKEFFPIANEPYKLVFIFLYVWNLELLYNLLWSKFIASYLIFSISEEKLIMFSSFYSLLYALN